MLYNYKGGGGLTNCRFWNEGQNSIFPVLRHILPDYEKLANWGGSTLKSRIQDVVASKIWRQFSLLWKQHAETTQGNLYTIDLATIEDDILNDNLARIVDDSLSGFCWRFTDLAEVVCRVRQSTPDRQFALEDSLEMIDTDSQDDDEFNDDDSDLITDPEDYYLDVSKLSSILFSWSRHTLSLSSWLQT